jgi:predicted DCC family thiol-disulfide oxidoreductase YuxK
METTAAPPQNPCFTTERHPYLLFYDGECSFCARWVERIVQADPTRRLRYGQQQGRTFARLVQAHPEVAGVNSVVLLKRRPDGGEDVFVRSPAIREAIAGLPKFRFFQFVLSLVPTPIANLGYDFFATYRGTLVARWHHLRPDIESNLELYVE